MRPRHGLEGDFRPYNREKKWRQRPVLSNRPQKDLCYQLLPKKPHARQCKITGRIAGRYNNREIIHVYQGDNSWAERAKTGRARAAKIAGVMRTAHGFEGEAQPSTAI